LNAPVEQATLPLESQLEARFGRFDEEHPEVWELFERFTFELIGGGHRHYGAAAIFERIRWHMTVTSMDSGFKLNNDFRPTTRGSSIGSIRSMMASSGPGR